MMRDIVELLPYGTISQDSGDTDGENMELCDEIESLRQQLAASQLREQQLLDGLENISLYVEYNGDDWVLFRVKEALAIPADTSALESLIAKAGEVMRYKAITVCLQRACEHECPETAVYCDEAILALPGVTLEDLKK